MNNFGDAIKDPKPRIRLPAVTSVTPDDYTGMKAFSNYVKPPENSVMLLHACYEVKVPGKLQSKISVYFDRVHNKFWWSLLNKYGIPINEYRNGPFNFPHQATNDCCTSFGISINDMERLV